MADAGFPLPSSSYKELIKIIQGYGRVGKEASLSDVARYTGIGETGISGNNKFLVAVGIIQGGKKKSITSIGANLANALEHELPVQISTAWRTVVESCDFLQKVVAAVRIRKGMDESSLESHIAYSAGQPKTPVVATGSGAVVEILRNAGLLKEEGGNLVAGGPEPPSIPETVEKSLSFSDSIATSDSLQVKLRSAEPGASAQLAGVQLTIDVRVQCTPNDLEDLGTKLRKLIRDLAEPSKADSSSEDASSAAGPAEGSEG